MAQENNAQLQQNLYRERVTNVFALAKQIAPLIDYTGDDAAQRTRDFLRQVYPEAKYNNLGQILDGARNLNFSNKKREELKKVAENIGGALLIAGGDKIFEWATNGELDSHMTEGMARISEVVTNNIFVNGEGDTVGRGIVQKLVEVEAMNVRAAMAPSAYEERRKVKVSETIDSLMGVFDGLSNPDSDDGRKIGAVVGALDDTLKPESVDGKKGRENTQVDVDGIFRKHINSKDNISTTVEDPNEILERLGLGEKALPDEMVAKLRDGNWFNKAEMDGLSDEVRANVLLHKKELKEWIQSYKAMKAALTEYLGQVRLEGEVDNRTPIPLSLIYEHLAHIEGNGFKSDDLTRNSRQLSLLYLVQMGHYTNVVITEMKNGKEVVKDRLDKEKLGILTKEIGARLFLHDSYLAMSKCHTIDDYMRTLMALYEGDIGGESAAAGLVGTILHREVKNGKRVGMGLKEIPVDMAWDLRQMANYRIDGFVNEIEGADWFIESLKNAGDGEGTLLRQIIDGVGKDVDKDSKFKDCVGEYNRARGTNISMNLIRSELAKGKNMDPVYLKFAIRKFLWVEPEIKADKKMRLYKPIYKNFWLMERDGLRQYKLIKEYMLQKMQMKRFDGDISVSREEARHRVEKAFDLAGQAAVAFIDNRSDIKYSGNEYSPLLNYQYSRIADNRTVIAKDGNIGLVKSKFVGSVDNIQFVSALTPYWLEFARRKDTDIRTSYEPLLVDDFRPEDISRGNDMLFQFVQIISPQSLAVDGLFTSLKSLSSQEITRPDFSQTVRARINKIVKNAFSEARVYCTTDVDDYLYDGWKYGRSKSEKDASTLRVAEKMNEYWLNNLFGILKNAGGTLQDLLILVKNLKYNAFMSHLRRYPKFDRETKRFKMEEEVVKGGYFIPPKRVDYQMKLTGVEAGVRRNDVRAKNRAETRWKVGAGK